LITALFEASFNRNLGFDVTQEKNAIRIDAYWFGESQSRALVTVKREKAELFKKIINVFPFEQIGVVTAGAISVEKEDWGNVQEWKKDYDEAIGSVMQKSAEV